MPRSATRVPASKDDIQRAVEHHLGHDIIIDTIERLRGGFYSSVYSARMRDAGFNVVVKVEPPSLNHRLTYEHHSLETEVGVLELLSASPACKNLPLPVLVGADVTGEVMGRRYSITRKFTGITWQQAKRRLSKDDVTRLERQAGKIQAEMHGVTANQFGYFMPSKDHPVNSDRWATSFAAMMENLYNDAGRFHVRLPVTPVRMERIMDRAQPALNEASRPSLVHWDLWEGNIFIVQGNGGWDIEGIIDFERSAWADPLMEVMFRGKTKRETVIEGNGGGLFDQPGARTRDALYDVYLGFIVLIESKAREYSLAWRIGLQAWAMAGIRRALRVLES